MMLAAYMNMVIVELATDRLVIEQDVTKKRRKNDLARKVWGNVRSYQSKRNIYFT